MIYSVSIKTNSKGFEIYDIYIYICGSNLYALFDNRPLPSYIFKPFQRTLKKPVHPIHAMGFKA